MSSRGSRGVPERLPGGPAPSMQPVLEEAAGGDGERSQSQSWFQKRAKRSSAHAYPSLSAPRRCARKCLCCRKKNRAAERARCGLGCSCCWSEDGYLPPLVCFPPRNCKGVTGRFGATRGGEDGFTWRQGSLSGGQRP
jgi:hypothetical protein